jgi:CxxC motif-containing protein (DUF1111 family)
MLARYISAAILMGTLVAPVALAQRDPGVRGGLANTGGGLLAKGLAIPEPPLVSPNPVTGLPANPAETASFIEGINRAGQLESACDACADVTDGSPVTGLGELDPLFPQSHTNSNGLGARHNADQCLLCHAQPVLGGSGGFIVPNPGAGTPMPAENPEFRLIPNRFGKQNIVPDFELQFGPIREVRFKTNPDGTPDNGVHQLWSIRGINSDPTIPDCNIEQPDFAAQEAAGNVAFRIPLQMFGLGLVESIQDREITGHFADSAAMRAKLGIGGHANLSGNDSTIMRFGWKAQNKSITVFAGEAYNVEMGVTSELFPQTTEENPECNGPNKPLPNDVVRVQPTDLSTDGGPVNQSFFNPLHIMPDWMQFQLLMRFMDAPQPDPHPSASAQRGKVVFQTLGCALCHTPQMQTAPVMNSNVLQDRPVNLYSDLLVHHMGPGLADGISQGSAGGDEFRTALLWGVGQRIFFMSQGQTSDMVQAIQLHASKHDKNFPDSEANGVIANFNKASKTDQQAVVDFLRSL